MGLLAPAAPSPWAAGRTYECPKEVNSEECHSECNQSDGLQPTTKVQVVHGAPQAEPARDGGQRRDEQEAHHVSKQSPLLVLGAWVSEPLPGTGGDREKQGHS